MNAARAVQSIIVSLLCGRAGTMNQGRDHLCFVLVSVLSPLVLVCITEYVYIIMTSPGCLQGHFHLP